MPSAISIECLSKQYGLIQALKNLSFQVNEGECVGLLGPNGAGKSTAIKILTGQIQPSSGKVNILGVDPVQNPKAVHPLIGYIPDRQSIYNELTVTQNIEIFRQIYKEPKERTGQIIQQMELTDKADTKGKKLSRGLRQRLLIARTLVCTPKVIFLDEPTTGLDPSSTDFVCQILKELKEKGVTLFLTTHLMSLAEKLCDYIVLLNKGEKQEEGTLLELQKRYGAPWMKVGFVEKGKQKTITIPFNQNFLGELAKIQKGREITFINTDKPRLEDIFIQLVRGKK